MTDHTALWAIFILLCVLFVVHIVVARRGPWAKPESDPQPLPPITVYIGGEPVTIEPVPGSSTLQAIGPVFRVDMLGKPVIGVGVPHGTILVAVASPKVAMMSAEMTLTTPDFLRRQGVPVQTTKETKTTLRYML